MCCLQELADEAEVVARLPEIVLAGQENQTETQALVDYQDTSVRTTSAGLAAHNKWQAYIQEPGRSHICSPVLQHGLAV